MRGWRVGALAAVAATLVVVSGVTGVRAGDDGPVGHVQFMPPNHGGKPSRGSGGASSANLYYHGGSAGTGVEVAPKVYVVFWGAQWTNNDPSGEASYLQGFLGGLYGAQDTWSTSTTQYCQNVPSGTINCGSVPSAQFVTHPGSTPLAGVWFDNAASAPSHPRQSQLANEAARAASHFGNTTPASNASVQYVVATAHGSSASGFGTQYCAWHSSVSSAYGSLAFTNLPYITDAGASCGAGFVNGGSGALDGVSIVAGHEYAETVTDQYPSHGWLDGSGAENGDKCAWISSGQGAAGNIKLSTGSFAVQSLWSDATSNCALSYP